MDASADGSAHLNSLASPQSSNVGAPPQYLTHEDEQKLRSAVVRIKTQDGRIGSGMVVKYGGDTYLLTCKHVLGSKDDIDKTMLESTMVTLGHTHDGAVAGERIQLVSDREGSWILADRGLDVALVRIFNLPASCTPAMHLLTPSSHESKVGDPISIIGHPDGYARRTSHGVITALTEEELTHSAPITFGSSGSLVYNLRTHEVVGMVTEGAVTVAVTIAAINVFCEGKYATASQTVKDLESMLLVQQAELTAMREVHRRALEKKLQTDVTWVAEINVSDCHLKRLEDGDEESKLPAWIKRATAAVESGLALKRKHGEI